MKAPPSGKPEGAMVVSRKGRAAYLGMLTPLPVAPPPVGIVRSLRKIEVPLRWVDAFSRWFCTCGSRLGAFGVWFGGGGGSGVDCWTTAGALGAARHIGGLPSTRACH